MRLPSPPPVLPPPSDPEESTSQMLDLLGFQRAHPAFVRAANAAYQPWDELRRRPLPSGASLVTAWRAVREVRAHNLRDLPLHDRHGLPFQYWITDEVLQRLLRIEAAATDPFGLALGDGKTPPHQRQHLRASMIEEAVNSSLIEGAATTRREARRLLEQGRPARDRSEQMIVNNFRTIELLDDLVHEPLSPAVVFEIHRSMTHGTLDDPRDAGRLQAPGEDRVMVMDDEGQVLHRPPEAPALPERLQRLCDFANATEPFVPDTLKAIMLHFQLAYDHPFVDGNGRTARALFYWFLLRRGHRLIRYLTISRSILDSRKQYARAYLYSEQDQDLTYFLLYHLQVYERALHGLGDYLRRKRGEAREALEALARWPQLNGRQKQLLRVLVRGGDTLLTAREHANANGVTHQTAMHDLKVLCAEGLVVARPSGRQTYFAPATDLVAKIEAGPLPRGGC